MYFQGKKKTGKRANFPGLIHFFGDFQDPTLYLFYSFLL